MSKLKLFSSSRLFAVITFLFGVFICQYTGNRGVFPIDSFSHFDSGYRILNGEHPFRDYWIVSGFIIDYFQSIIFYFLGINWQTYLLNASLLNGLVSLIVYLLFNSLGLDFKLSFFYTICFSILSYPSSGTPFVDHHSALLSLIAIVIFIRAIDKNNLYFWFLVPLFLFLAFLSKQVPASYILLLIIALTIFHLLQQQKRESIKILVMLLLSSLMLILSLLTFFKIYDIDLKIFITQYLYYPSTIGSDRYANLSYDFKNTFLNFKFIYISLFIFLFLSFKNFYKQKLFYKDINFKIILACIFLFLSLAQHVIVTKNQIFIFFLIPLFLGFANIQLDNSDLNYKKYVKLFLITLCIGVTLKYHYRFNIDRKFHELNNVDFSKAQSAKSISNKFNGLKWITPNSKNVEQINSELILINNFKNILNADPENKIFLSNYSFFSVLSDENISGFSRWYPGDNSAFPLKGSKYFQNYKDLIYSTLNKKKINSIYILPDVKENNLLDYVDSKCFNKYELKLKIIKYEINSECLDLFRWKIK